MNEGACVREMGAGHACPFCGARLGITVFDADTDPAPGLACERGDFACREWIGGGD